MEYGDLTYEEFEKAYYGKITAEEAVANMAGRWEEILSK